MSKFIEDMAILRQDMIAITVRVVVKHVLLLVLVSILSVFNPPACMAVIWDCFFAITAVLIVFRCLIQLRVDRRLRYIRKSMAMLERQRSIERFPLKNVELFAELQRAALSVVA